jgi:tetratricopeptide (TPR) repeat protein
VLVWELIVRRNAVGRLDRFAHFLALAVGLISAASLVYLLLPAGQWLWAGYEMRSFTLTERLLTEGRVLWFYLGLMVLPRFEAFGLYHDDIPLSTDLLTPWTTLPAWLGLLALAWVAWRSRQRAPLLAFGIAWFLVGHLLESTMLPLEIAHEHRNYLPSFGLFIAAAWALARLTEKPGWQKTLGITLATVAIAYFSFVTALRAHLYGDELQRTQIEAQHHPESARTQYTAGRALVSRLEINSAASPQYFFARKHYERAGELEPGFKVSWLGLIHLNCQVGQPAEAAWINELVKRLHESPLGPGDRNVLFSIKEMSVAGTLCLTRDDVARLFDAAITNPGTTPHVRSRLSSWFADYLALVARDLPAAQAELDKSLAIAPHNPSNRLKRAQLAFLQGRHEEASAMLDRLQESSLLRSERETMALLRACLGPEGSAKCFGR